MGKEAQKTCSVEGKIAENISKNIPIVRYIEYQLSQKGTCQAFSLKHVSLVNQMPWQVTR
jgi:hypothetical protein